MNKLPTASRWLLLCFSLSFSLRAEVKVVNESKIPAKIQERAVVLSADWASHIPPGGRVNAPDVLRVLYPGQKIALAIIAEGSDRDRLLNGVLIDLHFSSLARDLVEQHDLKPVTIRQIKAEGADLAIFALNAAGVAQQDREKIEESKALVSFAVFFPEWTAPLVEHEEEIQISATISGNLPGNRLKPIQIKVRPMVEWLNDPPLNKEELGKYLTRYHDDLAPGRLLSLLKASVDNGSRQVPSITAFFAIAYSTNRAARDAAVASFSNLDPKTQFALVYVLRQGGQNVSQLLPAMTADAIARLEAVEPMKDPRDLLYFNDPVSPEAVRSIGVIMDQCWSGWMATGDQSYLRALVGLLEGAPDYPALQSWMKVRGGAKGLNAHVAKGLAYQIAGWSLGSFQRTDPHVADWLYFWENDPAVIPQGNRRSSYEPRIPPQLRRDRGPLGETACRRKGRLNFGRKDAEYAVRFGE